MKFVANFYKKLIVSLMILSLFLTCTSEVQSFYVGKKYIKVVHLTDLNWKSVSGFCKDSDVKIDMSYGGSPIRLVMKNGVKTFSKGLGVHATSKIVYDISGQGYSKFSAYVGVDASMIAHNFLNRKAGIIDSFTVYIDGKSVGKTTRKMQANQNAYHIEVDIPEGAKEMWLVCDSGSDDVSDWANWADAKFYKKTVATNNVALASNGVKTKAVVTATGETYDAEKFGGNPDPRLQIEKVNDGVSHYCVGGYFDFGRESEKNSIYLEFDLLKSYKISDVKLWRYWQDARVYDGTVVVLSDDKDFSVERSHIIYNSDTANVHKLGTGHDRKYIETAKGKTFYPTKEVRARYARIYMYGNNLTNTSQIVEVKINAELEIKPNEINPLENAAEPIDLKAKWTNDQVVHPDIVTFSEAWSGYKYWMVYTPNKTGTSYYENPCIVASNDLVKWVEPDGIVNPIQPRYDSDTENDDEHNCDAEMIYDKRNDRLIVYWQWTQDKEVDGKIHQSEIRYRVSYDGVNWGTPEGDRTILTGDTAYGVALKTVGSRYSDVSPCVVYDESDGMYKLWANDAGNDGYEAKVKRVWYIESPDPLNFSEETDIEKQGRGYVNNLLAKDENSVQLLPWHLDIQKVDSINGYLAVVQAYPENSNPDDSTLRLSRSKDGLTWYPVMKKNTDISKALLTVSKGDAWDSGQIYRATFWFEPNGKNSELHLWYSGLSDDFKPIWKIGYTKARYGKIIKYLCN